MSQCLRSIVRGIIVVNVSDVSVMFLEVALSCGIRENLLAVLE